MLSDDDIKAIEDRSKMATPAPWEILLPEDAKDFDGPYPKWRGVMHAAPGSDAVIVERCGGEGYTDSILNADFIAAARTDIPKLCEALREARQNLKGRDEVIAMLEDANHGLWLRLSEHGTRESGLAFELDRIISGSKALSRDDAKRLRALIPTEKTT